MVGADYPRVLGLIVAGRNLMMVSGATVNLVSEDM